ncbi:hypothetical protein GCM10022252_01340 [Streptosporangium oxazolinicum]|uniref:Small ribosomal subunit protein uS13 n=2 Tax=Streptosporangiaceae TaxID=2004 RepID=A0ABP8A7X8_9ACTN
MGLSRNRVSHLRRRLAPYPAGDPRSEAGALTPGMGRGSEAQDLRHNEGECPTMARLVGVDLPRDKRLEIALTYIFGIGRTRALETLKATGVSGDLRVHQLTDEELVPLRDYIEANYKIEGDLRREVQADIRRKIEIQCYQGIRHRRGLPVHGQRTQTNARTRKGKKKTVAGKKKPGKK